MNTPKKAIILGAGPAGLAMADELLRRTDIQPVILGLAPAPGDLPDDNPWNRIRMLFSRLWAGLIPAVSVVKPAAIAHRIEERGGKILYHQSIFAIYAVTHEICSIHVIDALTGEMSLYPADYFFSTVPIRDLIPVRRDVIKVDLELSQIAVPYRKKSRYPALEVIDDHLYMEGEGLKVTRVNLCSTYNQDPDHAGRSARIVMEYCCTKGDRFWSRENKFIQSLAVDELENMGLATINDIMDIRLRRVEQGYTGSFQNLFPIGYKRGKLQSAFEWGGLRD